MTEVRVKGSAFLGTLAAIEPLRGVAAREAALAGMRGPGADALRSGELFASVWYDGAWYRELLATAERTVGEGPNFIRELGRVSTKETVSTIHRVFMRLLSPDTLMKQGARVFASYFDAVMRVESIKAGEAHISWSQCHGFDRLSWLDQLGSTEQLVSMSGAESPRLRVLSGGGASDSEMVVECRWRP